MKKNSIKRWIVLSFTAILLLSVAASAAQNWHEATSGAMAQSEELAEVFAEIVSNLLAHQWKLDEPAESDAYVAARKTLRSLCQCFRMEAVSIYTVDPETSSRTYVFSVAADQDQDLRMEEELTRRTEPSGELLPGEQALLAGSRQMQRQDRPRVGVTWIAPYTDQNGELCALIRMDDDISRIRQMATHSFLVDIIPLVLVLSAGMLILLFLVQRRIVRPIEELSNSMRLFARDSRKKPEPLNIHSDDEIGEIAKSFEKMTEDIISNVNHIEKLTKEQTETDTQLALARRIQHGLVPAKTKIEGDGFCVSAMTRPEKAVGGDFYDCFGLDKESVCVVMGDVSGEGISAAICMSMIRTIIREKLMAGLSPAEALNRTNDQFCAQNPENLFVTAFAAVLNTETGELRYANAGHTRPVLIREEPALLVPDSGIALGMFEDSDLKDDTLTLSPSQGILLYTDGVTEALSPQRIFFGEGRLLGAVRGASNAEEVVLRVSRAVAAFCDGNEPSDDMAVLALTYTGEWMSLPVALNAFEKVREAVFASWGNTPETRRALLACDEALTNIVNYSGAANLSFSCDEQDGWLRVTFSDNGIPYDPTAAETEEKAFETLDSGGMGLNLIRHTASSMHYERKDNRNVFTLFFELRQHRTNAI